MYRTHVCVIRAQGQCPNFMPSLEGYSFNSGYILFRTIYMPACQAGTTIGFFYKVKIVDVSSKLIFLFFRVSKDLSIRASYGNPQRSQFSLYSCLKVRKTAKIRKRYNQVPHLTQGTTWESNKNTLNIHKNENHVRVDKVTLMFLL